MSDTKMEKAVDVFSRGFNCSQAVLSVYSEEMGISVENALKIASSFGSGMRQGEVCGAVSGALMVLGLQFGHSVEGDKQTKGNMYGIAEEFHKRFIEKNNSIICKKLLAYDVTSEDDLMKINQEGLFQKICPQMIKDAVEITEELLVEFRL